MAVPATTRFSVMTTGNDNNGGGFDSLGTGTNYSFQAAPQWSITDLSAAQNSTTVNSVSAAFTSACDGNIINIIGGTNFVTGLYRVTYVNATTITLDRAPCTAGAGSAGQGNIGGAFATPGKAGGAINNANTTVGADMVIKTGTYSITSTTANVSGGCVTLPANIAASNSVRMIGYNNAVGDIETDNSLSRPILQASGIATATLLTTAAGSYIEGIDIDGASLTAIRGVLATTAAVLNRCKFSNCTNSGMAGNAGTILIMCEATGCGTAGAALNGACMFDCIAYSNTVTGIMNVGSTCTIVNCLSINNSGASSDGFGGTAAAYSAYKNCTAYGNGRHGFNPTASSASFCTLYNCYAEGNAGYGFTAAAAYDAIILFNCSGYNNTSGNVNNTNIGTANQINFVAGTGTAFVNAAGLDFTPNTNTGGGNNLRGGGLPGTAASNRLRALSAGNNVDIGAVRHTDPASTITRPGRVGYSGGMA